MKDNQFLRIYKSPNGVIFHLIENPLIRNDWSYEPSTKNASFLLLFEQIHQTKKEVLPIMIAEIIKVLKYKINKH
jgi:hypothetical protein